MSYTLVTMLVITFQFISLFTEEYKTVDFLDVAWGLFIATFEAQNIDRWKAPEWAKIIQSLLSPFTISFNLQSVQARYSAISHPYMHGGTYSHFRIDLPSKSHW